MTDARWTNLTAAQYHADPAVSRSQIKTMLVDGPEEFESKHVKNEQPFKDTDATELGTIIHDIVLRNRNKADVCCQIPKGVLSKSGARSGGNWDAFKADCDANSIVPLKDDQWNAIDILVGNLKRNETANNLIAGAIKKEATCEWQDEETGLMCRVMFDLFHPKRRADLKTTEHVLQPFNIAKQIASMGYHWQDAFYSMGAEQMGADPGPFVFIFGKVNPPYNVRCYTIPEAQREIYRQQIRVGLRRIADALNRESFAPEEAGLITEVGLPRYTQDLDQWIPTEA